MFETRKMKKTTVCRTCSRSRFVWSRGRIRTIDAPVVPIRLASTAPIASIAVLTAGVARQVPLELEPAGDHVQAGQQDDERDEVAEDRVLEHRQRPSARPAAAPWYAVAAEAVVGQHDRRRAPGRPAA